jgi:hypothetical protein
MQTVWKYTLPVSDIAMQSMPLNAEVIHVAEQHGQLCMWALVRPSNPQVMRHFRIAGTGHPISNEIQRHVGSVLLADGDLVFHVFEVRP